MTPSIVESFDLQARWCQELDSPIYADVLDVAAHDLRGGGIVADIVEGFDADPVAAALPLRLLGGVHRLVLMGIAEDLAKHYPSVGGSANAATLDRDFLSTLRQHPGYLRDALTVAPQTNEVGRATVLLTGIGSAITKRARAVRILEIGSAAGLNLRLDRFRYDGGSWSWGDPGSPVHLAFEWTGRRPDLPRRIDVVDRMGCDVAPIDVSSPESRLRMLSFVWPDQLERFGRMRAAIDLAGQVPVRIEAADAASWVAARLAEPSRRRTLTVVLHSAMWWYLPDADRRAITDAMAAAGSRADASHPIAHVWFETTRQRSDRVGFEIGVETWPGAERRILGYGHPHGAWFQWDA